MKSLEETVKINVFIIRIILVLTTQVDDNCGPRFQIS
jgi:hypothetical protein